MTTIPKSTETLQKFFPSSLYALFIATTQVIYTPETEPGVFLKRESECDNTQRGAFWLIFVTCCVFLVIMGQTHDNTVGGPFYNINKCFDCKFYNWNNVMHITAALLSFAALALCGHDASICIGLNPKDTQYVPVITAAVFAMLWQSLCSTQPKWFVEVEDEFDKEQSSQNCAESLDLEVICEDVAPQQLVTCSAFPPTKKVIRTSQEIMPSEPKQTDSSSNWMAFYAMFPKYHCTAFNSIQAMLLVDQTEWGKAVLISLYGLQSVLIIVHHVITRSKDWTIGQDGVMGIAIWLNFTAITLFQHDTAEYLFGGIGCFSSVGPVCIPMLVCFMVTEFGTARCLSRYVADLNEPL